MIKAGVRTAMITTRVVLAPLPSAACRRSSAPARHDFAEPVVTHLSVKTLRHYHETELLAPDQVDAHSGYRYYSTDQIPSAQIIRRFRDLDMPVRDIARLLSADVDERAALISDHLARLECRLAATTEAVRTLQRLLAPDPPRLQVVHRREPIRRVTAVTGEVDRDGATRGRAQRVNARIGGRLCRVRSS